MITVGIVGASGFVGSTLVETLVASGEHEVRPFIHRSGNAWRLARLGIELQTIDLLSPQQLDTALQGCTHVVNCSRGPKEVMNKGLSHLLDACRRVKVQRFVHLSSSAVYNGPYPQTPIDESFTKFAEKNSYGGMKLAQDEMVNKAHRRGLSTVVLCPPNITGPYSAFVLNLVETMRRGRFAIVEDGTFPCMLLDVHNLVHAIVLSLTADETDGGRIFVTDNDEVSWRGFADRVVELSGTEDCLPSITLDEAQRYVVTKTKPRISVTKLLKHLVSSDVRDVLRKDPLIESVEKISKSMCSSLPNSFQRSLQSMANGSSAHANGVSVSSSTSFDSGLIGQQLRRVRYCGGRAEDLLGYRPIVNFNESFDAYCRWYSAHFGRNSQFWDLFLELSNVSN